MRIFGTKPPLLSIIVAGHNMARELPRTLTTLLPPYQVGVAPKSYEVIVVESNSTQTAPLAAIIAATPVRVRHLQLAPNNPSPCEAMMTGLKMARGEWATCMVDGARMVSPAIVARSLQAARAVPESFSFTLSFHLGSEPQDVASIRGYDQHQEDQLLASVDWIKDGYALFDIACLANSSQVGLLQTPAESNFLTAKRAELLRLEAYDRRFVTPGGGLVNLDLMNRLNQSALQPVLLLGEGTFHQFHGGVATNVAPSVRPMQQFKQEYLHIRGNEFAPVVREPLCFGVLHERFRRATGWAG